MKDILTKIYSKKIICSHFNFNIAGGFGYECRRIVLKIINIMSGGFYIIMIFVLNCSINLRRNLHLVPWEILFLLGYTVDFF